MRSRIIVVLMLFAALSAASFMIEGEKQSSVNSSVGEYVSSSEKRINVYFFYGDGCPHCEKVKPFIAQMERKHSLTVYRYEIYRNRSSVALLNQYFDIYAVPTGQRGIPALFVSDSHLVGDEPILNRFELIINEALKDDELAYQTSALSTTTNNDLTEDTACSRSTGNSDCLSLATATTAALADSVSPCSLAVFLFLIGVRPLVQDRRKRALKVGLAFMVSVYVTYTLFGFGLLSAIGIAGVSSAFSLIAGLIAVLVGIFYVRDYFLRAGRGSSLEVPHWARPLINKMIKGVTSPIGAFLTGFVICCFELPCTGGPYLFIIGQLSNSATWLQAVPMLLYYNFLFIMPLLLISLFLYFGLFSLERAKQWNERNKRLLRLVSGLTIIALGILVVPGADIIGLVRIFSGLFKAVIPPALLTLSCYLAFSLWRSNQSMAKRLALTIPLATLLVLGIFAFPQMFRVVQNAAGSDTELLRGESPSDLKSTQIDDEKLCATGNSGCGRADELAESGRDSVLKSQETREFTAEELAEIEERAKLYDDETANEAMEKESEDETKGSGGCDGKSPGTANPAAIYCSELGYEYKTVDTAEGKNGICRFPDNSECDEWEFLAGKCGQEYSYCSKQGYGLITKSDGKDPFSQEYAVCTYRGGEIGTVTNLFSLSEKAVTGSVSTNGSESNKSGDNLASDLEAPSSFDWRNSGGQNWITPVKNQNPCGSCWAFSAIGVTEALYNIYTGNPNLDLDLSEQFLVSDCFTGGTCCGGWHNEALGYIRDNGIPDEACFPYVDSGCHCTDGTCDAPPAPSWCNYRTGGQCSDATCSDRCADWQKRLTKIDSYAQIPADNLATMKERIVSYGPLSVAMGIGTNFGGYFDANNVYRCTDDTGVNHAVVIVGYNDTGSYWIVKNSWGATWGPNGDGFFRVGYTECDIESLVYYAQPDRKTCGETITSNTVLVNQLSCPGNGLIIGTSHITLDCQGYAIWGSGSGVGIDIVDNYVTIKNCVVRDFANGIYLHNIADYNTLIDNEFYSNEFHGIYLYDAWSNYVAYNDVTYNGMNGLYFYDISRYNDIIDNNFWFNGYHGIELKGTSDSNDFTANYFYMNGWSGMGINTDNNLIQDSTSRDHTYHGFDIRSTTGNRLVHNWIWYNDQYGIYLYNSTNTQITDNRIRENDYYGVYSSYSNYTTIQVSQFDGNMRRGVYLYHSHHNTIQTSYFHQNHNESIYLYYADDNFILDNDIQLSGLRGIDIRYSNNNVIQFNDVRDSANMGIYVYGSDSNDIWSNYLDNNDGWSVYLLSSDFNDFRHNIVNHPIDYGLYSSTSYNTVFQNNTVCGYLWDFYTPSSTYTANENTCDDAYQFVDSGQPNACDFECSGCRKAEDDLFITKSVQLCPYTYNIEDLGSYGVINIWSDGVTLDCQGAEIVGVSTSTGRGIRNVGFDNVRVRNCKIRNYLIGIVFETGSNYGSILNNNVSANGVGIYLTGSNYGTISGNTANFNTQYALFLYANSDANTLIGNIVKGNNNLAIVIYSGCDNNHVKFNTVTENMRGIWIYYSNNNYMHGNIVEDNNYGVYFSTSTANNELDHNRVCRNGLDIHDDGLDFLDFGDNNFCTTASNWDDTGTTGCTFSCLLGDIDVDGDVDVKDLYILSRGFGSIAGSPVYHPGADLDVDDDIDRDSLIIFNENYGKTYTAAIPPQHQSLPTVSQHILSGLAFSFLLLRRRQHTVLSRKHRNKSEKL